MRLFSTFLACLVLAVAVMANPARAQQGTFIQIEALPTLGQAEVRARAYSGAFGNVNGFRMRSGWYAIVLGPYTPGQAAAELVILKRERLIPADSYIARPGSYQQQFWPAGADTLAALTPDPEPEAPTAGRDTPAAQVPAPEPEPAPVLDETPREARASESLLTSDERKELQEAMQWDGFYTAAIDGAFGAGTRRAMGEWQRSRGYEVTGILTTRQRDELLTGYRALFADLGLASVTDRDAGIEMILPLGKVAYARTDAPFVQYDPRDDSGMRVLLISQTGDEATLFGLYDIIQTLEIVPPDGPRERRARAFTIEGRGTSIHSYTEARITGGAVKGFTLVWGADEDPRIMQRVLDTMKESFRPMAGIILPDTALSGDGSDQRIDLLAGLEIRTPERTRTGFFVDGNGAVLTTTEAVRQCRTVTLGSGTEADVTAEDEALGLALLKPRQSLAPIGVAEFQDRVPRLQSEIAVAGFSYGAALELPVLSFGTLADIRGLAGEPDMQRLDLETQPGDAGGPVMDQTGAVVGLLRSKDTGSSQRLPDAVSFAVNARAISGFLAAAGLIVRPSDRSTALAPEDISTLAMDMTVRVSCWN